MESGFDLQPIEKLRKDLRQATALLSVEEIRYSVDLYYQIQEFRKAAANQVRALLGDKKPVNLLGWTLTSMETVEKEIKQGLEIYTEHEPTGMGAWAKSICGIGPVLSAGLLAHIEIKKAPTVGHIWRFAGLDPTSEWKKGQKRPWNAALKVLTWKIGESFVKVSGNRADIYGKIWLERKAHETAKNDNYEFREQADNALARRKIGKETEAYKAYSIGKLPPAHIHARAKRYAVKLFLSHWWEEAYRRHFGKAPPLPYPIAMLGHSHWIRFSH